MLNELEGATVHPSEEELGGGAERAQGASMKGGARSGPGISPARNGSKWIRRKKRLAIYHRDDWRCLYCGADGRAGVTLTLDHYLPGRGEEAARLREAERLDHERSEVVSEAFGISRARGVTLAEALASEFNPEYLRGLGL